MSYDEMEKQNSRIQKSDVARLEHFHCRLPMPPSVNGLYPTCRGKRVKSQEYKRWLTLAALELFTHDIPTRCVGEIKVRYNFWFPKDKRRRDVENYCKAVSDFLVERGVIEDDSMIQELTLVKGKTNEAPYVIVQITELSA